MCAAVLVRNVRRPVVITVSHAAGSRPGGHGDNARQTADTISFSVSGKEKKKTARSPSMIPRLH